MSATVTPNLDHISLYYKAGTSDKEYHLEIKGSEAEGWKVEYRYGKRGAKLTAGWKTKMPVDYVTARRVFEIARDKQLSEGYTTGESGTPYVGTENQGKVSGLIPQTPNIIEEEEVAKYLNDDAWCMQEKKDGVRCMIRKEGKTVEGINKKGIVTSLPLTTETGIREACQDLQAVLDGELVGEKFWLFDTLAIGIRAWSNKPYSARLEAIQEWLSPFNEYFEMVPTAIGKASKKAMFAKIRLDKGEGVVFKKLDSLYVPGRPASYGDHIKFKFKGSATVRCKNLNNKNSFVMEMMSKGDWIEVGNCTFFPTVLSPKLGKLYEVEYLYAYPGGSLFQPTLKEERKDCDEGDCGISQLKYKQGTELADEDN